MLRISGLVLKLQGRMIASDGKHSIIVWIERSQRNRTFHYLVKLQGAKYTKPYRLQPYEVDYWLDTIKKTNEWKGR